jgi:hypothetical protein
MEAVEPQSLKKLSLKSLKRALDLFSPLHQQLAPPDPERFNFFPSSFLKSSLFYILIAYSSLLTLFFFFIVLQQEDSCKL